MVYVDPLKLEAHQLSVMDVVRAVNDSNLILPAGDVRIGPFDYNIYANSQTARHRRHQPTAPQDGGPIAPSWWRMWAKPKMPRRSRTTSCAWTASASVYLPVLKQGGDANTIAVVDGIKERVAHLLDVPKQLVTRVVFDQSVFVKTAIENLLHEGGIGLVLTGMLILVFFGSMRATVAVFLSIPLVGPGRRSSRLSFGDTPVNAMVLGGLALAFSRLIDNSVVVLENIFRHIEAGEAPEVAAEKGGTRSGAARAGSHAAPRSLFSFRSHFFTA